MFLYLYVSSYLGAQLFVNSSRVSGFGKLVRYRTAEDQFLVEASRPYFYRYTHIKAPTNPLVLDNTSVSIAQSQMMPNKGLNCCSLIQELLKELSPCSWVCCFIDDIDIFLSSRVVCNVLVVVELKSSWHSERSILPRWVEIWVYLKLKIPCRCTIELDFASSRGIAVSRFALQRPYRRKRVSQTSAIVFLCMKE